MDALSENLEVENPDSSTPLVSVFIRVSLTATVVNDWHKTIALSHISF
jgi:hypothetical protein